LIDNAKKQIRNEIIIPGLRSGLRFKLLNTEEKRLYPAIPVIFCGEITKWTRLPVMIAQIISVDFQIPFKNLLAANIQKINTKAKIIFEKAVSSKAVCVIKFSIKGVSVMAIKMRIVPTTLGVKSFLKYSNRPVVPDINRTMPPISIEE